MGAAVDIGANDEAEKFLDPKGVLMGKLDRIEQFTAELLDIVLLEGLRFGPLEASQEIASEGGLRLGL